jgi:hypothetical protein
MSVLPPPYEDEKNIYCFQNAPQPNGSSAKSLASQSYQAGLKFPTSPHSTMSSAGPVEHVPNTDPLLGISGAPSPRSVAAQTGRQAGSPPRRNLEAGGHDRTARDFDTPRPGMDVTVRFPLVLPFRVAVIVTTAAVLDTGCWAYSRYYTERSMTICNIPNRGAAFVPILAALMAWHCTWVLLALLWKVRFGCNGGKLKALLNFALPGVAVVVDTGDDDRETSVVRLEAAQMAWWVKCLGELAMFVATCVKGIEVSYYRDWTRPAFHTILM